MFRRAGAGWAADGAKISSRWIERCDSLYVARNIATCRESGADCRIYGAVIEWRLVTSGESGSRHVASRDGRIRHTWRVGAGKCALYRAKSGEGLPSGRCLLHIWCKRARRGAGLGTACLIYGAMRCCRPRRPAADRAARWRGRTDLQRATLNRSGSR
jgi:hypothetical protein